MNQLNHLYLVFCTNLKNSHLLNLNLFSVLKEKTLEDYWETFRQMKALQKNCTLLRKTVSYSNTRDNISSSIAKIENYLWDRRAFVCDVFCTLCIYLLEKNSFFYLRSFHRIRRSSLSIQKVFYCIMQRERKESFQLNFKGDRH